MGPCVNLAVLRGVNTVFQWLPHQLLHFVNSFLRKRFLKYFQPLESLSINLNPSYGQMKSSTQASIGCLHFFYMTVNVYLLVSWKFFYVLLSFLCFVLGSFSGAESEM